MADLLSYCKIVITTLSYDARAIRKLRLDTITPALLQCWQRETKSNKQRATKKQKEQKQQQQKSMQIYFHICLYFKAVEQLYYSEFPPTNERFVAHPIVPHAVIYAPSFGRFRPVINTEKAKLKIALTYSVNLALLKSFKSVFIL